MSKIDNMHTKNLPIYLENLRRRTMKKLAQDRAAAEPLPKPTGKLSPATRKRKRDGVKTTQKSSTPRTYLKSAAKKRKVKPEVDIKQNIPATVVQLANPEVDIKQNLPATVVQLANPEVDKEIIPAPSVVQENPVQSNQVIEPLPAERAFIVDILKLILQSVKTGIVHFRLEVYMWHEGMPLYVKELASKPNCCGETPFIMACVNGHLDVVRFLVETVKVDVSQFGTIRVVNGQGVRHFNGTALHGAIVAGHCDVVNYLLTVGQSILNKVTDDGSTALHLAATYLTGATQHDVLHSLLAYGADVSKTDGAGKECWELLGYVDYTTLMVLLWPLWNC